MEPRDLAYFRHAASTGHLGRAAEHLGLTQPALTKSIARLERELNARVFDRTSKGLVLTAFGTHLLGHATRVQAAMDDASRELNDLASGRAGHLRIGTGLAMAQYLLPLACTRLLERWPGITMEITAGTGRTLIPGLRDGHLDLVLSGIPAVPDADLRHEVIMEDDVLVIARRTHALHASRRITLRQLLQQRWVLSKSGSLVSNWLAQRYAAMGVAPPAAAVETDSMPTLLGIVAGSDLLTFHSWSSIRRSPLRSALRPLAASKLAWRRRVGVTYRRHGYLPSAARTLIGLLKEVGAAG